MESGIVWDETDKQKNVWVPGVEINQKTEVENKILSTQKQYIPFNIVH